MMDWLAKMLGLPKEFLASSGGCGGGVIQVNFIYDYTKRNKKYMFSYVWRRDH
jgi:hypothetical protein